MKLFNRSPEPNTTEHTTSWDSLRQTQSLPVESPDHDREQQIQQNRLRQERKAINAVLYGPQALSSSPESVTESDHTKVFELINSGKFTADQESAILRNIKAPDTAHGGSPEQVFRSLDNRHSRRILAYVNNIPDTAANLQQISSAEVSSTLQHYPTPIEFAQAAESFMQRLQATNTPEKCQEYARDLAFFQHQLYGKRQEYYEAFQSLQAQAAKYAEEQSKRARVLNTFAPQDHVNYNTTVRYESQPSTPIEVTHLNPAESAEILHTSRIDGDPFVLNGQSYNLTTDYLGQVGLNPEYKMSLNPEVNIAFSKVFKTQGDHDAVIAYVHTTKGDKVVSYYRSNSQGGWRYLPDYAGDEGDPYSTGIDWFGKGYSEESLNLPIATQAALEIISAQPHVQQNQDNPFNSNFVFAGTAKRYEDRVDYQQAKLKGKLRGDHYAEVSSTPTYRFGTLSHDKRPPAELDLTGPSAPDFQKSDRTYQFQASLYGPVTSEHYRSQNNQLLWTFNHNQSGQAWIGGIEVNSPISSAGLHTEWAQAGDYGTPLFEYQSQDGGYGDHFNRRGDYVNMWDKYLSQMPIIRKYLYRQSSPQRTDAELNPLADSQSYWAPEVKAPIPPSPAPKKGFFSRFRK